MSEVMAATPDSSQETELEIRWIHGWGVCVLISESRGLDGFTMPTVSVLPHGARTDVSKMALPSVIWANSTRAFVVVLQTPYHEGGRVYESFKCPACSSPRLIGHYDELTHSPPQMSAGMPKKLFCKFCRVELWYRGEVTPCDGGGTGSTTGLYITENLSS